MIIFDPAVWDLEHAPFNAGLLQVAGAAHDGALAFWAEPGHVEAVRGLTPPTLGARVTFEARAVPARHLSADRRLCADAANAWRAVRQAADAGRDLVFASSTPGILIGAKMAMFSLGRRRRSVLAVQHGPLAQVWGWRSRNPLRRLADMTGALAWPAPGGFRLVILEAGIADALATRMPALARQILVLEHPIAESIEAPAQRRPGPVRLGFLGLASREKGFDRYCALATLARQRGADAEFHAIGMAAPDLDDNMTDLATRPRHDKLDRGEFVARLCDLDLVVMTHDAAHYAYSPSGVLLDALAASRPLLSLPNPLVEAIAARYGPIGPAVADLEAAAALIVGLTPDMLAAPPFTDYRANLARAAAARRPDALAAVLAAALGD